LAGRRGIFWCVARCHGESTPESDRLLLAHGRDGLDRIGETEDAERCRSDGARLLPDGVSPALNPSLRPSAAR
jgi:hypothetical protein